MQHVAAADGVAVNHGNHGLRKASDLLLNVKHRKARHALLVDIAAAALDMHVAAGTKGNVARARENHDIDVRALTAVVKRVAHLRRCRGRKGVAVALTVNRDAGNALIKVKEDFLVILDFLPFAFHGSSPL